MISGPIILDVIVVATVIQLIILRQRRNIVFSFMAVGALAIAVAYARWHFQWTWLRTGKISVNGLVPALMAYMGNHLAAEVKESKSARMAWRAAFFALAALAFIGGVALEIALDQDHQIELLTLRGGIRDDFKSVLVDYNQAHPQHPLSSEQIAELVRTGDHSPSLMQAFIRHSKQMVPYIENEVQLLDMPSDIRRSYVSAEISDLKKFDGLFGRKPLYLERLPFEPAIDDTNAQRIEAAAERIRDKSNADFNRAYEAKLLSIFKNLTDVQNVLFKACEARRIGPNGVPGEETFLVLNAPPAATRAAEYLERLLVKCQL